MGVAFAVNVAVQGLVQVLAVALEEDDEQEDAFDWVGLCDVDDQV